MPTLFGVDKIVGLFFLFGTGTFVDPGGPTPVNDNPLGCVRSVMFTGSIAVPRPGDEGCGLVVGGLSAVLVCGLVSFHLLGCWLVCFYPFARYLFVWTAFRSIAEGELL